MSTCKEMREASLEASKMFDDFGIGLWMRHDFFKAIKKFKEQSEEALEWDNLDDESKRYVNKILQDFERNGLQLSEIKRRYITKLMT